MESDETITDSDKREEEYKAYEHLKKSLTHARKAKEKFNDGSKGESVADNVVRWAEKSIEVAERYLKTDN